MFPLGTGELARLCGGMTKGAAAEVRRVVIDSRDVQPGDLFVALRGARADGHEHLGDALEKGAAAALVEADGPPRPEGLPVIVVSSCLEALAQLARAARARLDAPVVGITGSVGKTTAKDFLAFLLGGPAAGVFAAPASYNSEIGLPLAVLAAPADARLLVLEYGINAPGEMDRLVDIVCPDHAWLTAVAEAHLAGLGGIADVAREKGRLPAAVGESGTVWLDPETAARVEDQSAGWPALVQVLNPFGACARGLEGVPGAWHLEHPRFGRLSLPLGARHQVATAVTAAHLASALGVPDEVLAARLPELQPPAGRMTIHRRDGLCLLEDSYNANPASMRAALDTLQGWPGGGPRWAVLGTMHELGDGAEEAHRELGRRAVAAGVDELIAVGEGGAWLAAGAAEMGDARVRVRLVDEAGEAAALVVAELPERALLLLKASRSEGLERVRMSLFAARPLAVQEGAA